MATRKQKKVARILAENGGMAISKAMELAGYSPQTAKTPGKLTESKGWAQIFDENITDDYLMEVHKRGLEAFRETPRVTGRTAKGEPIYEYVEVPDFHAQHKFLETAYKAKGRFVGLNSDNTGDITINLAIYGQDNRHTVSVQPKTVSASVSDGNGRRIQKSGDSLAQAQREGQDGSPGSD